MNALNALVFRERDYSIAKSRENYPVHDTTQIIPLNGGTNEREECNSRILERKECNFARKIDWQLLIHKLFTTSMIIRS